MADRGDLGFWMSRIPAVGGIQVMLVFALLLLFIFPVSANVLTYAGKENTGSIQDLINTTNSGDSIYLTGGTYHENLLIDRPIVFGALDTNNPPEIISSGASDAGITLAADGITINGVIISGTAGQGLLVHSNNNRISAITIRGFPTGISLKSAMGNIFSGNAIVNNSVGIVVDRSSRSNIFYLNYFDNTREVDTQSADNVWSGRQSYRYSGADFSGPLGNFWKGFESADRNGDGIRDTPYIIQSSVPGLSTTTELTDRAPLFSTPGSYTLVGGSSLFNTSPLDGGLQPPEFSSPGQQGVMGAVPGPSTTGSTNPFGPQNPFLPFLAQYWWVIPIALVICVVAGIWFERKWKRRGPVTNEPGDTGFSSRNVTVVKKTVPLLAQGEQDQLHYAARLPPALEKKYPMAEYRAEGGVSRVFRAWDEKEGRDVAVKIPIRFDEVTGTQFTKELHVWEGLHHKNIVEIYAANIFPVPYIEMEFVESSLAAMRFPLETDKALVIVRGVAEGLRYAHERGIVHRDIKPENIMVAPDGTPKISDWGLSKAEGTKQSGLIGFSLEYAAPEQLAPNIYGEPGPWTDIYQLGVLFYEMLAGDVPFRGGGMGEVTHAILHDEPLPLILDGQDAGLIKNLILKCMAKKPQERYGSVSELLDDLKKVRS
jgi:eukaryotic-like serine/threonine-protein kinase